MTYRVTMIVRWSSDTGIFAHLPNPATVTVNFAGCADEEDAKNKARYLYDVEKFKKVELIK